MQVSSQPYLKTYTFPVLSVAAFLKLLLVVMSVALPFFITYSTPNFYLASHLSVSSTQPITYNYRYHIEITTSMSTYLYTNLYNYASSRAIAIEQTDVNGVLAFRVKWSKSNIAERVMQAQITLFFNYVASGVTQLGMATGRIDGYSIAEGSIAGIITIERGTGQGVITQSNLTLNGYNLLTTGLQMSQSLNYLNFEYSTLPINLPTDMSTITMTVNYGPMLASQETPSILGQLVWSWVQYFPIFLTIYWLLDKAFVYLLKARVVRSRVMHDPQYLALIEEENARRQRLRQV